MFRGFVDRCLRERGYEIGVVVADYLGELYLIKNIDHALLARMEQGNIFSLLPECLGCHREDSFDDLRRAARDNAVVHDIYRTAQGRSLNRTSAPVKILNEEWIVSTSIPYERVQGQINANARNTFASAAALLLFMGGGAYVFYELQKRTVLEAQYYTIVDTIRVGLCRMTARGQIVGANPALAEMLGLPREELIGQELAAFAPDRGRLADFLGALRSRGEMLAGYREMMEKLARDKLAIPICIVDNTWSDNDITDLYHEMRKISEEYARNMRWAK